MSEHDKYFGGKHGYRFSLDRLKEISEQGSCDELDATYLARILLGIISSNRGKGLYTNQIK